MNMRHLWLCTIALVFFYLTGCDKQRESVVVNDASDSQVNWTVLVYAAGNYAGDILSEPVEGTLSRAVSTVRVLEKTDAPEVVETYVCLSTSETSGSVGIYRVTYSGRIPDVLFDAQLIQNIGPASMADPATLDNFLNTVLGITGADHYLLALSGDGVGWRGVLGDNLRPDGMSLFDLHGSIERAALQLPSSKFDVLCLYARNMGTIETIAELRDHADYIMASPWSLEQPHSLIISEWYQDLSSQPHLSPSELGAYVIDAERLAQDSSHTNFFATLWRTDRFAHVENAFEIFAANWAAIAPEHSTGVTALRGNATDAEVYNSNFIDLARYAELFAADPEFADETFDDMRASAFQLNEAVSQARVARFGSTKSLQYGGLNLYFPTGEVDTVLSSNYRNLEIAHSAPSWTRVIDSLASRGNSTVTITGKAFWPNHTFRNAYFYVDSTIGGQFGLYSVAELNWTPENSAQDTISYSATFDLQSLDSLSIEFGIFIDLDQNGFDSGDSLGGWNNGSQYFTPFTVSRGEAQSNLDILVRLRRP